MRVVRVKQRCEEEREMLIAQKDSLKCRCKEERDIPSEVKGLVIQGGDTMNEKKWHVSRPNSCIYFYHL